MKTIKGIFFEGMNKASLNSSYCENVNEELSELTLGEKSLDIDEIIAHFNTINDMLKDKMYKEKAEGIFKNIPMKMEKFYEKFDKECMDIPIFKYYDPYQFFQRISCANNEDIVTIKEKLIERAKKYTKEIEPELNNIVQLKNIVDDYTRGKRNTESRVWTWTRRRQKQSLRQFYLRWGIPWKCQS